MTAQGSGQVPAGAFNKRSNIVSAIFASCSGYEGAIRGPREAPEEAHRLLLLSVKDVTFGLFCDVFEVLDAPYCQLFVLTRLACNELAKGVKS